MLLAAFGLIESRHPAPLVPLRLFRSRTLVGANLVTLLFSTITFGVLLTLTLYAQQVLGYSAFEFGLGTAVFAVMAAAGSIKGQAMVQRLGFRAVAAEGMALMGGGSLLLTQAPVAGSYFRDIFFALLVFGTGLGTTFVTATVAALAGIAKSESGLASGLSNTTRQICAALGVAIVTTVALTRSQDFLAANQAADPLVVLNEGFQAAFLACAALAAIGMALALLLPGRPPTATHERPKPVPDAVTAAGEWKGEGRRDPLPR
jgi:predicted MFS family arabinose efflux permease